METDVPEHGSGISAILAPMVAKKNSIPRLVVVGHTNVGKTSLMRTLMRDPRFGEVAPTAATTRQVESANLLVEGRPVAELFDTPGLEDAGALLDLLEGLDIPRHDGPARLKNVLDSEHARDRFEQEARVLEQVLHCDATLYVIDTREPVLGKYQDELAVLNLTARPLLPVLNFTGSGSGRVAEWRDALARIGLHAVVEFDTVIYSRQAEARLWQRLAVLLEAHAENLAALVQDRQALATRLHRAALVLAARLMIDVAAARRHANRGDADQAARLLDALKRSAEQRERRFIDEALRLYRFEDPDVELLPLPIAPDGWRRSLFEPGALQLFGRHTGTGAAAGAASGAAVDVATGGLSLGAGTLIGLMIGSGGSAAWQLRHALTDRLRGRLSIMLDDAALTHLAARAKALIEALDQRGHAAHGAIRTDITAEHTWPEKRIPDPLLKARNHPQVSRLNTGTPDPALSDQLSEELAGILEQIGN